MKRKSILIIKFSKLENQPRIYRQIHFLKDFYNIVTAGFNEPRNGTSEHINIKIPMTKYGLLDKFCWNLPFLNSALTSLTGLGRQRFDLIIAHDPFTLPLSLILARESGAKVLLDAHEYTPRQYEDQWIHRYFFMKIWDLLCREYLPKTDAIITVCKGIAEEYNKNYGVHCEVITNASYYSDLGPKTPFKDRIKIIYHGAVHPSRRTEDMISLMDHLDNRFHLDLMLVKDSSRYFRKLSELAEQHPRVTIRDPVPMPDIPERINGYDIGLFLLSPETFSYRMALPNKLFEFIQGRLAIAIWPSPEMAKIVNEYKCGIVSGDFTIESIAKQLNSLSTKDIEKFKMNSHKAAGHLCAENNKDILLNIVEKLLR
jgi:glycosyltransferase involved in cell wall biosynthesis